MSGARAHKESSVCLHGPQTSVFDTKNNTSYRDYSVVSVGVGGRATGTVELVSAKRRHVAQLGIDGAWRGRLRFGEGGHTYTS